MSCSQYGIPIAPLVANHSHIKEGWVYISNPVDGAEAGGYYSLKTICPLNFQKVDNQVHPNILFDHCRLLKKIQTYSPLNFQKVDNQVHPNILFDNCRLLKKIQTYSQPKVRLSKLAAKQDCIGTVHLTQSTWSHIFSKHTVKETYNFRFIENRANTTARAKKKLCFHTQRHCGPSGQRYYSLP